MGVLKTRKEIEEELKFYETPEVEEFGTYIPRLLNLPFEREVEWNFEKKRIEIIARMTENVTIDIEGHKIPLRKGEKILLAVSHRYPFEKVTSSSTR